MFDFFEEDDDIKIIYSRQILASDGDPIEAHRQDDPNVWGLLDIAAGRDNHGVPQTIYFTSGDSASGVAGRLTANGEFISVLPSGVDKVTYRIGTLHDVLPVANERTIDYIVGWDGARKPESGINEETGLEFQEHTKGRLLGDIPSKGTINANPKQGTSVRVMEPAKLDREVFPRWDNAMRNTDTPGLLRTLPPAADRLRADWRDAA